ncbi:MAG: type II toxin-antitoxin system Phd/YefM family antitoxin [Bacteroidetes bacterium]|nr:type II toxin-antitoxin system Phd/YefM family antitoxin [Bacteroidota bacterium]MCH8524711.1 type II toxin-antitoxin system Phd/YefM family antitoxin [Balneolales bacterium]
MTSPSTIETVNIHQAKTELSHLVKDVLSGKRVQIARNGKPVVELRLIEDEIMREPGLMKNQIWVSEDFDDYSADIATLFEGDDRDE